MIAGCDTEDEIEEGAAKIYNLITGADTEEASTVGHAGEFALMGVTFEENPFLDAEDEGVFDSGCSRSMTDTECLMLSKDFKLLDESMMVLRVLRKHNLYTINLNNLCLKGNLACLVANASVDEYVKWHRRMGHVNYKNINILVKGDLVRGLPPKLFKNDHTCVACCKGKQHKASYKAINDVWWKCLIQKDEKVYAEARIFKVALTLKTKGGLELISFDDLYYKLKTLEVDVKGYTTFSSSQSAGPSQSAFVSTTSARKKMSYGDSLSYSSTTTYTAPSNPKTRSYRSGNVIEDVLQSFVNDTEPEQQLAYEDFEQIEKLDLEEMHLKWKMAMLFVRVHKFKQKAGRKIDFDKKESARFNKKKVRCYKCQQRGHFARECRAKGGNNKQIYSSFKIKEIRKKEEDSKALITVDTLVNWTDHDGESNGVIASKEFGMIAGCDTEDEIEEGVAKIYNLITRADTEEAST
nr:ribonuclease H-like domain-containing protein [Tanacetum cinerariifolium]